jgi:hypothetical protein
VTNALTAADRPAPSPLVCWASRLVLVAMLVAVIGVMVVVRLAAEYDVAQDGLPVPCIKGLRLPEARRRLRQASPFLSLQVGQERPSTSVPAGIVLEQTAGCGASVNTLEPILVVVSTGG